MEMPISPMVGRGGLEPPTNGLKERYALSAREPFPLCMAGLARLKRQILHHLCQILPTWSNP